MTTTVLKAKNQLSELLRRAETGEEIIITRGRDGKAFLLSALESEPATRCLDPDPRWMKRVAYADEALFESEWSAET